MGREECVTDHVRDRKSREGRGKDSGEGGEEVYLVGRRRVIEEGGEGAILRWA